jgi:hypothetical protein
VADVAVSSERSVVDILRARRAKREEQGKTDADSPTLLHDGRFVSPSGPGGIGELKRMSQAHFSASTISGDITKPMQASGQKPTKNVLV